MTQLNAGRSKDHELDQRRMDWVRLVGAGALAATVAVAGTAIIQAAAAAAGLVDGRVVLPSLIGMGPLRLASVSLTAVVAVVGASILLAVLLATTRRPIRVFRIVTSVLALASLSMPATIPGPPVAMRLTMVAMHVVVWAVSVGVLATLGGRPSRTEA
ncbi:MAG: DUF6069 family protein [Candidatus Dormibacteraeota bacterium]|nr:DUF6069 family protein [Candidatus Dormibacteraeota bacterium]